MVSVGSNGAMLARLSPLGPRLSHGADVGVFPYIGGSSCSAVAALGFGVSGRGRPLHSFCFGFLRGQGGGVGFRVGIAELLGDHAVVGAELHAARIPDGDL